VLHQGSSHPVVLEPNCSRNATLPFSGHGRKELETQQFVELSGAFKIAAVDIDVKQSLYVH
jgi:hypothetical protein